MRGWHDEPMRHGLAARGIKTSEMISPHARPSDIVQKDIKYRKGETRKFIGSGLEGIRVEDITEHIMRFVDSINEHPEIEYDENIIHPPIEMEGVYVFGSRVTGYYVQDSDVDVFIMVKPTDEWAEFLGFSPISGGIQDDYPMFIEEMNNLLEEIRYNALAEEFGVFKVKNHKTGRYVNMDVGLMRSNEPSDDDPSILIWWAD